MLLYIFFIISIILFGSVFIGPLSIRVYATVVMMAYLIINYRRSKQKLPNSFIYLYLAFIILMGIAMGANGEFNEFGYVKTVLSYHLVSIVAYYATGYFNTTRKRINITISVLVIIMLATSIVTILQYFNHPAGWVIGNMFGELNINQKENIENIEDILLGSSLAYGIMQHSFINAMKISVFGVLSFCNIVRSQKLVFRILNIVICMIGLTACFMTQQRSAFYMMVVAYIICMFVCFRKQFVLAALIVVPIMYYCVDMNSLFNEDNVGRLALENTKLDNTREKLWSDAWVFISGNILWGGPVAYESLHDGLASHNFFFNAFIYGGLLGGIVVIILFFKILAMLIIKFINMLRFHNLRQPISFCAIALIIYLIQGFFHNESLVTGSDVIMLLLALILVAYDTNCLNKSNIDKV